ncbi:MAG: hypothetical protein ABIJ00_02075 [Candidatus Eisenbacteria bacterium]
MSYRYSLAAVVLTLSLCFFSMPAEAAEWEFHDGLNAFANNPDRVTVYGTIDCVIQEPPLYQGWIEYCETVTGCVPPWCNDYIVIFQWAPNDPETCGNVDTWKVAVPGGIPGDWLLEPLAQWVDSYVPAEGVQLPTIGDATGAYQYIYVIVDLEEYLASYPVTLLEVYSISNGESPDLPGYLIGTTPIVFDPAGVEPFSTTPFTGDLWIDGDVWFWPGGASATEPSTWGRVKNMYR